MSFNDYQLGYYHGRHYGNCESYPIGHSAGYSAGYSVGYSAGYSAGYSEGSLIIFQPDQETKPEEKYTILPLQLPEVTESTNLSKSSLELTDLSAINPIIDTTEEIHADLLADAKNIIDGVRNSGGCKRCNPRQNSQLKKHVIGQSICENYIFYYDLHNRNYIIILPIKHLRNINDLNAKEFKELFNSIDVLCNFLRIPKYTIIYDHDLEHDHMIIKIKISNDILKTLKDSHFKRILDPDEDLNKELNKERANASVSTDTLTI